MLDEDRAAKLGEGKKGGKKKEKKKKDKKKKTNKKKSKGKHKKSRNSSSSSVLTSLILLPRCVEFSSCILPSPSVRQSTSGTVSIPSESSICIVSNTTHFICFNILFQWPRMTPSRRFQTARVNLTRRFCFYKLFSKLPICFLASLLFERWRIVCLTYCVLLVCCFGFLANTDNNIINLIIIFLL